MQNQKRIKTQGCDFTHDLSSKKERKVNNQKGSVVLRQHKQSEMHIKSVSKDITPKKHSINVKPSKNKDAIGESSKKLARNKQLISVCSYSGFDKESIPATKRKSSNTFSMKKKQSKNKQQIQHSLKSTVSNFSVLTKCLTEYIKEQKKKGKDPSKQILQLIKAFNRSQVAPLSKELQLLISNMLDYIQGAVQFPIQTDEHHSSKIKSRNSFSEPSEREIVYSQILESSLMPPTVKKQKQFNQQDAQQQKQSQKQLKRNKHSLQDEENDDDEQFIRKYSQYGQANRSNTTQGVYKQTSKQLENQLKQDLKNMHDQLHYLRSAGEKLQTKAEMQVQDKKKLQQIYTKNKKMLENISNKNSLQLKNIQRKTSSEAEEDSNDEDDS